MPNLSYLGLKLSFSRTFPVKDHSVAMEICCINHNPLLKGSIVMDNGLMARVRERPSKVDLSRRRTAIRQKDTMALCCWQP